jgi:hypothetical protein
MPYQQARDYSTEKNAANVMRDIRITATRLVVSEHPRQGKSAN